jgi:Bifunctional DNA primase/polymerase, N-terminal
MSDVAETRLRLLHAGFAPLPITGKVPPMPKWQKLAPDADAIRAWDARYPDARSTGYLTRMAPVFDVDILNPDAAEDVESLVRERLGDRGRVLVRTGREPKRCIPLSTDTPFKKIIGHLEK